MERDQQVLLDRIAGRRLREIGDDHSLTAEGVRQIARRETDRHITELLLEMTLAQKTGDLLALAVPAGFADDQLLAVRYLEWVLDKLSERGVKPRVHYQPLPDGSCVFAVEDANFKPKIVRRTTR